MTFPELLATEQKSRNLTQASFAEFLGVSSRTLWGWLQGEVQPSELIVDGVMNKLKSTEAAPKTSTPSPQNTNRNYQIVAAFLDTEETLRSPYTSFSGTETKAFCRLLNLLRDQILQIP